MAAMSTYSSRVRLGITAPLRHGAGAPPLPHIVMPTTIADCINANTAKTKTLASMYAVVDNPTACSRRKIARSPISVADRQRGAHEDGADVEQHQDLSRLVGRLAALIAGTGTPKPTSPGTDSDSTPMMNGSSARKMK